MCLTAPFWHHPSLFGSWRPPLPVILSLSPMSLAEFWKMKSTLGTAHPAGQKCCLWVTRELCCIQTFSHLPARQRALMQLLEIWINFLSKFSHLFITIYIYILANTFSFIFSVSSFFFFVFFHPPNHFSFFFSCFLTVACKAHAVLNTRTIGEGNKNSLACQQGFMMASFPQRTHINSYSHLIQ